MRTNYESTACCGLMQEPEGLLESMMATNVYSAYHMTRGLITHLDKSSSAHIFNICSVAALQAYDNGGAYSITKYALRGFNTNLRKELMSKNIKVTGIFPGATWTDSWAESGVSASRLMSAKDIAKLILQCSLLSPTAVVEELVVRPLLGDL
jgi:NADP-dependent 3-hydroxy acid dehydrogenase YdfG